MARMQRPDPKLTASRVEEYPEEEEKTESRGCQNSSIDHNLLMSSLSGRDIQL